MNLPLTAPADPAGGSPEHSAIDDAPPIETSRATPISRGLWKALLLLTASVVACLAIYLVITVPGKWFASAGEKPIGAQELTMARGAGQLVNGELVITAADATGLALVSAVTSLRSTDYPAVEWRVSDIPQSVSVRLLWRSDYAPEKLNTAPIAIEGGRALATIVAGNPAWIGRITGLALGIQGNVTQPIRVQGVVAKPMGLADVVRDRAREWFAFEHWSGTSINTVSGGSDVQPLPLPFLLACAVALATLAAFAIDHWRPGILGLRGGAFAVAVFVIAWFVLDARWTANLVRQEKATAQQFAGKDLTARHLSGEDAPLFAFIEHARRVLPKEPVRIFIASDADYFRGRAAYHLYPHSVYFDPRSNELPPATELKPGDWLLVFQRRGMQYDPAHQMLRWDGQTRAAELKLVEPGGALFLIR